MTARPSAPAPSPSGRWRRARRSSGSRPDRSSRDDRRAHHQPCPDRDGPDPARLAARAADARRGRRRRPTLRRPRRLDRPPPSTRRRRAAQPGSRRLRRLHPGRPRGSARHRHLRHDERPARPGARRSRGGPRPRRRPSTGDGQPHPGLAQLPEAGVGQRAGHDRRPGDEDARPRDRPRVGGLRPRDARLRGVPADQGPARRPGLRQPAARVARCAAGDAVQPGARRGAPAGGMRPGRRPGSVATSSR